MKSFELYNNLPKNLGSFIWYFILKQKYAFLALTILHLAWSIDQTIFPYAFKIFLDRIVNFSGDKAEVWSVITMPLVFGGGIWILTEVMFRTYDIIFARTHPRLEANIRMNMFNYIHDHSYRYFADSFAGSITNKINDMAGNVTIIMDCIIIFFIPTLVALTIGISIFANLHPMFALVILFWFCLHIGISLVFAKKSNNAANVHSESKSKLTGKIVDSFTGISTVKAFAGKLHELNYIKPFQNNEQKNRQKVLDLLYFKIRFWQGNICFLIMGVFITWLMIIKWQADVISSSELVYIFYTSWGLTIMSWICGMQIPIFFESLGICKQAFTLIEVPHEIKDDEMAKDIKIDKGNIVFENVAFFYEKENKLFKNKNINIKAGSKVGLVGVSGSGKTTFVNLIMRFFDIESGIIKIDNQDISKVTNNSLREQIAIIPQDPVLFHRNLLENISYGKENVSKEEIIEASKKAHCHEFITKLPQGYNTLVGERGVKLSGGQRQRIAIGRAILKDAPILILDEATSALDSITEKYIQESLEYLMKGRTTIVIAHRLSTLSTMDRILVFDHGSIVEDGNHEKLINKKNGYYSKIWNMQVQGFINNEGE